MVFADNYPCMAALKYKLILILLVLLLFFPFAIYSQESPGIEGFAGIAIGIQFSELDQLLRRSSFFHYRGEDDVSLSPGRQRRILEVEGSQFIQRGIFQLVDGRLFSITLMINPELSDHYSLFTTFSQKYGEPNSFGPQRIIWENDVVRLTLERPLTVQYLDIAVFSQLQDEGRAQDSMREISRQLFLEQF